MARTHSSWLLLLAAVFLAGCANAPPPETKPVQAPDGSFTPEIGRVYTVDQLDGHGGDIIAFSYVHTAGRRCAVGRADDMHPARVSRGKGLVFIDPSWEHIRFEGTCGLLRPDPRRFEYEHIFLGIPHTGLPDDG